MRAIPALTVALSLVLSACGAPRVHYTYTKPNMTPQAMLHDKKELEDIHGVRGVFSKIDDHNMVWIEIQVDEKRETKAIQYLLDNGYAQVRN
jgi:hypothetical protein